MGTGKERSRVVIVRSEEIQQKNSRTHLRQSQPCVVKHSKLEHVHVYL